MFWTVCREKSFWFSRLFRRLTMAGKAICMGGALESQVENHPFSNRKRWHSTWLKCTPTGTWLWSGCYWFGVLVSSLGGQYFVYSSHSCSMWRCKWENSITEVFHAKQNLAAVLLSHLEHAFERFICIFVEVCNPCQTCLLHQHGVIAGIQLWDS